jgi:hypothetical protein
VAEALLSARGTLFEQCQKLEKRLRSLAREDGRARLLMTAPGVGTIVALTYAAAIDDPSRFRSSKAVGAHFGLTRRKGRAKIGIPLAHDRQRQGANPSGEPMVAGLARCLESRLVAPSCLRPRTARRTSLAERSLWPVQRPNWVTPSLPAASLLFTRKMPCMSL